MPNTCPHCGETHEVAARFCPATGNTLSSGWVSRQPSNAPPAFSGYGDEELQARKLFAPFLAEKEMLRESFYLGRVGILKPMRVWIAVTDRRVLGLIMTHYFFQDAGDGSKVLHSFALPVHHLNFEEPSVLEMVIALVAACILAFFTFGISLAFFALWWWRVYRRKGFIIDGQAFLCSGQKDAAWRAIKVISVVNEAFSVTHGA